MEVDINTFTLGTGASFVVVVVVVVVVVAVVSCPKERCAAKTDVKRLITAGGGMLPFCLKIHMHGNPCCICQFLRHRVFCIWDDSHAVIALVNNLEDKFGFKLVSRYFF